MPMTANMASILGMQMRIDTELTHAATAGSPPARGVKAVATIPTGAKATIASA